MSGHIIGLDLSLTAPGMAMIDGIEVLKPKTTGVQRLTLIRDWVLLGVGARTSIAMLEGYSYASKFSRAHSLGELGGVVKVALAERDITIGIVEPKLLKKFATDNGNASKGDMLKAALRSGYDDTTDDNAVDAWWLRQFGIAAFDRSHVPATSYRAAAVATWIDKREAA